MDSQVVTLSPQAIGTLVEHYVQPIYPRDALIQKVGGIVVVEVALDKKGQATAIDIVESSHESLSISCEEAVRRFRYIPALNEDIESASRGKLIFYFTPDVNPPLVTFANQRTSVDVLLDARAKARE